MTYANGRMTSAAAECALQRSAALTATSKQLLSGSYSDPPHTTFTDSFQADGQAATTRTLIIHSLTTQFSNRRTSRYSPPPSTDSFQPGGQACGHTPKLQTLHSWLLRIEIVILRWPQLIGERLALTFRKNQLSASWAVVGECGLCCSLHSLLSALQVSWLTSFHHGLYFFF